MDYILICFILIYNIIALLINLRLIYIFEDVEDSKGPFKQALFSRIVVIFGLQLLWLNFMIVPVNIINEYPIIGSQLTKTINIKVLFMTILYLNILFISTFIPYSIFYYEIQLDSVIGLKKSYTPYLFTLLLSIIFWLLIGGSYGIFRTIHLNSISSETCSKLSSLGYLSKNECSNKEIILYSSFSISTTGFFLFVGYIYNIIFIGVGCALIPLYLIYSIKNRPKLLNQEEYNEKIMEIYTISKALFKKGNELKKKYDESLSNIESNIFSSTYFNSWQNKRNIKQKIYKYKSEVIALNTYFENIELGFKKKSKDYFDIISKYVLLILSIIFSLSIFTTFILNLTINELIPYSGNQSVNLIFILFSLILPVYIGICVCFTWNTLAKKVCYCFPIHILKKSATPMNSMIFNIGIVLFPIVNIVYITNLASSWLFKSDLYYLFFMASNIRLNYKFIPNHILIYSLFGVSLFSIIFHLFSYIWDKDIIINQNTPQILHKYLENTNKDSNSKN